MSMEYGSRRFLVQKGTLSSHVGSCIRVVIYGNTYTLIKVHIERSSFILSMADTIERYMDAIMNNVGPLVVTSWVICTWSLIQPGVGVGWGLGVGVGGWGCCTCGERGYMYWSLIKTIQPGGGLQYKIPPPPQTFLEPSTWISIPYKSILFLNLSQCFDAGQRARQWYFRALCKISKRFYSWQMNYAIFCAIQV